LDLQHFGPPQRRRRVFVVAARTGGGDPAEILALSEGLCGHPAPRQQAGESVAGHATGGAIGWDGEFNAKAGLVGTLQARTKSGGFIHGVLAFHPTQTPISGTVSPALEPPSAGMGVLDFFSKRQYGAYQPAVIASTLGARDHAATNVDLCVTGRWPKPIVDTLVASYAEKFGQDNQHINSGGGLKQSTTSGGPRRLTPRECERLMGWPDDWTATGVKPDGTVYRLADTPRYRLAGNGVGSPCAEWIARRLLEVAV